MTIEDGHYNGQYKKAVGDRKYLFPFVFNSDTDCELVENKTLQKYSAPV